MKANERQRYYLKLLTGLLVVVIIVAAIAYLVPQLEACQHYTTIVPNYVPDVPCTCTTAVGSFPQYGVAMIRNTSFSSQFTNVNAIATQFTWQGLTLELFGLNAYMATYFKAEFSTVLVHNKTLNVFEIYNPRNLPESAFLPYSDQPYLYGCVIYGVTNGTQLDSANCLTRLTELRPGVVFDPIIDLGYQNNGQYQQLCELQSCLIQACTPLSALGILLQAAGIISSIMLLNRFIRYLVVHWCCLERDVEPEKVMTEMIV